MSGGYRELRSALCQVCADLSTTAGCDAANGAKWTYRQHAAAFDAACIVVHDGTDLTERAGETEIPEAACQARTHVKYQYAHA
jgi:hypothetical protein